MTGQLAFDLPPIQALKRADFLVSDANALALQAIDSWRDWPEGKLVLVGPEGSGKTHLAHIWAEATGAVILPATALAQADLPALSGGAVVVEDAQTVPSEAALFHLYNLATAAGTPLLLTADRPPRDWGLGLPDLLSRMQAVPVARLEPPDDALLSAVLVKLFADRQIVVSPALIPFLVSRMSRSVGDARALVAALDARALAAGKPVTRQLAADLLGVT
ncbi:MAG: chromosomal replication initiator DnaA [Rhodobacterales bacterium 12-65-15]|nr:MAG: chromosomal replication initiator DnaA [Rhodobacterales bacterium 12-65-15]